MSRRDLARRGEEQHWRFRPKPGSDYIASGFALGAVIGMVERGRPRSVLEVGAGIGTLTEAVARVRAGAGARAGHQVAVEEIGFCIDQLRTNLGPLLETVLVVDRAADVPAEVPPYDLVLVDGGATTDLAPEDRDRWTGDDERAEVRAWIGRLAPRAVVVVENERARQRSWIEAEATRPFVHEHVRPLDASPGYHRYRFDPTPVERVLATARNRVRAWWFPAGVRAWRRLHLRLTGSARPARSAVAPGDRGDQPGS